MSRLNKKKSVREVKNEVARDGREASKKGDALEHSASNSERLNRLDQELTANLPSEEVRQVTREMSSAYSKGKADFRRYDADMEKHLRKEEQSKKEVAKAVEDASRDTRVIDQAIRAEGNSPIAGVLKTERTEMERIKQALDEVVSDAAKQIGKDRGRQGQLEKTVEKIAPVERKTEQTNYVLHDDYMEKAEEKQKREGWGRAEQEKRAREAEYNQKKYGQSETLYDSGYKSAKDQ